MNTLKSTINRLQELSYQQEGASADVRSEKNPRIGALVGEIERMTREPLFRGRSLGEIAPMDEPAEKVVVESALDFRDMRGIEVLEGRFESTNDHLVGVFEEPRNVWRRRTDWSSSVLHGLRTELAVAPMSIPIVPFTLRQSGGSRYDLQTQLRDHRAAGETADATRDQILAMIHTSVGAQANTLGRAVQSLVM